MGEEEGNVKTSKRKKTGRKRFKRKQEEYQKRFNYGQTTQSTKEDDEDQEVFIVPDMPFNVDDARFDDLKDVFSTFSTHTDRSGLARADELDEDGEFKKSKATL